MKWNDTVASQCRYGSVAGRIFSDAEIIWESSECDYQGHANILAHMPDGTFVHYEWSYGSCSGCDEWEARDLGHDEIEQEMRRTMAVLTKEQVVKYFNLDDEFRNHKYPSANKMDNGGLPGMIRTLMGGVGDEFRSAGEALREYLNKELE